MKAELQILTACITNSTYLKTCYCTTPFKVANITEDKNGNTLRLMLMSSSPGILDGDEYHLNIELEQNSSLQLHTQSYQRLFTMTKQASQQMEVRLAAGASFCFIPHPCVPHEKSGFIARNKIFLTDNCNLIFGEILTCGRKLNGEVFLFAKYHTVTEIFMNDRLVIKENLLVQPQIINVSVIGQLQGFTHQASLIYLNEHADIKKIMARLTDILTAQEDISFGITAAPVNGIIIRVMGQKAEQLFDCLKMIAGFLPQNTRHKTLPYAI
ncbi:urease accessory protein UreD [soil metagenome]